MFHNVFDDIAPAPGNVRYLLKTPYRDDIAPVIFEPQDWPDSPPGCPSPEST